MYIPSIFSTAANGCPSGSQPYNVGNYNSENLNSGARGRVIFYWNTLTTDVIGENFAGSGSYSGAELGNGQSTGFTALKPTTSNIAYPSFGTVDQNITLVNTLTGSIGQNLVYCYNCQQKFRWTFGSKAGLPEPWPATATPLTVAVLSSPSGSNNNNADYKTATFNFTNGTTGTIEGYGPVWQWYPGSLVGNSAAYYIISREAI